MLGLERKLGKAHPLRRLPPGVSVAFTFLIVCLSWVFFRAKTLGQAVAYLGSLFGLNSVSEASNVVSGALHQPYYVGLFALCGVAVFAMPNSWELTARLSWPRVAFATTAMLLATLMMWTQTINPFLYFQF
jgi:alginate O-acetyltransferase complex protein AlgI